MEFAELHERLKAKSEFTDLDDWTVTEVRGGLTSPLTYRLRRGDKDYFVKEVKDNERDILKLLIPLHLDHVPRVVHPDLLDEGILVTDYIAREPIKSKELQPGLIRDYATMQNHLNSPSFLSSPRRDDGFFFGNYVLRCFREGWQNLVALNESTLLPVVGRYVRVAERLGSDIEQLAHEYSAMPFAWLHHDFREGNILAGRRQMIVDWGSSYGHGPLLYDLAPFCFANERNMVAFAAHSDICREAQDSAVARWLCVATAARFASFLRFMNVLADLSDGERSARFLEYHYETYGGLLTWKP